MQTENPESWDSPTHWRSQPNGNDYATQPPTTPSATLQQLAKETPKS